MESKDFDFLMYSIVLGNWNHALNIIERLKKELDSNQLPILIDIRKAIIARKNEDYETAKKLWKQIQIKGKNLNEIADFAKVAYYDTIADSNVNIQEKCYLKVEDSCRKIGDPILILISESLISNKPNETATLLKTAADKLTQAGDTEDAYYATALHYTWLAKVTEKSEETAELYKKAAEEFTKAEDAERAHSATGWYYAWLALTIEEPEKIAKLYKKAAEEFTKAKDPEGAHYATGLHYKSLVEATEKPEEKAELYKKAAEEFTKTEVADEVHNATAWYYTWLALTIEEPEEKAELYKKAAEEFTKAEYTDEMHNVTAWYYMWLALTIEEPEEIAKLYKKAAKEFTKAEEVEWMHFSTGFHYRTRAEATEKPKEKAELYKKAAEEFTKAEDTEETHNATAWYYASLADATKKSDEKAELYKKAAEELIEIGKKEDAHNLKAKQYFFLSLSAKNKYESERYQILASGETKLGWLYLAQIAFNESKKSKTIKTPLLELTIELYKKYLQYKNRKFPVSGVYLCGDITESTKQIMPEMSDYFKFNVTSFPRDKFRNTPEFKEEVKNNDFVLMELNKDIGDEFLYELGLVAGMEKPIIVLISENINSYNKFLPKVATVISNLKHAFTALKLFSVIKSGESLAIKDKTEKSAIDELIRGFKERPLFISQFELDKTRLIGRYRGKS